MQDRVVIFDSRVGFLGRPIQRHHLNLPPDYPCCHGNEIWDKIGYNSAYIRDITEIFTYNRGFSGSGYWMTPDKFCHDQPHAMATKFGTKSAITLLVQEISLRCLHLTRGMMSIKFYNYLPWLPWQRNLRQNRL